MQERENLRPQISTRVLIILAISVFFVGATEFMLSSMLRPLANAFNTTPVNASWLVASYAIAYAVSAPILGYISDRVDRRSLLLFALLAFSIDGAAISFAPTFETAVGLRVFGGIASAIIIPTTFALISEWVPRIHQAKSMGVLMLGMTAGIAFGPALAGILTEEVSWRAPFTMTSLGCVMICIVCFYILPHTGKQSIISQSSIGRWYRKWPVWRPLVAKGCWNGSGVAAFLLSGEILQHRYGYDAAEVGMIVTAFGLGLGLGNLSAGILKKKCRLEELSLVIVTSLLMLSISIFMLVTLSVFGTIICLVAWGAALGAGAPSSTVVLAERSAHAKGTVLSFAETMNNIVIFAAMPLASFLLAKQGAEEAYMVIAFGLGMGLFLTVLDAVYAVRKEAAFKIT
ncbi:arabinose ABC transporter permease [Vibrio gazogenes]|uniref:Arabinose ABC transporter permease n=2 Tax=Vibrio gazogenes TaxID=687 RepID=A0A1Z2SJ24_VIBGA|nr:arabinose ABC transporter permease [Vibrio gazogenes]